MKKKQEQMKYNWALLLFYFFACAATAQVGKENNLIADGNKMHQNASYINSEAEYRKALSLNSQNTKAQHNLGNSLYRSKDYTQANQRFFQSQKNSTSKDEKHLAFHNMGNGFMLQKKYENAVEAYKNALRNNPADEDTRYNYALAKELLKKQQEEQEENQDQQDQDQQDQQENNDDQQKNNDDSEGNQKEQPSDDGKEGDQKDNNDEKQNQDEEKDKEKPQDSEGDKKDGDKKQPPPRQPGQISPEQVKSLLDAMNKQEKEVQDKVNAKKVKGVPVKTKKDW